LLTALLLLPSLLVLSPAPAVRADATSDRLDAAEKKLDAALAEIERLKLGAAAPETSVTRVSRHGFAPAASRIYDRPVGASIGGYGEAIFSSPDGETEGGAPSGQRPSADLLRAVFYVGYKFTPELLFNSEIEFEHAGVKDEAKVEVDPLTGEGEAELSGEATMEFGYLDWQAKPWLGVRAGKMLVPVGLVNEQHEPPVFYGARRPDVETLLIPSTWAGAARVSTASPPPGSSGAPISWRGWTRASSPLRSPSAAAARAPRRRCSRTRRSPGGSTGRARRGCWSACPCSPATRGRRHAPPVCRSPRA
jgi:hypothetical protein